MQIVGKNQWTASRFYFEGGGGGGSVMVGIDKLYRDRANRQCAFGVPWPNSRGVGLV